MKKFLSEYGFTIIAAIVIITLVVFSSPIGNTIKRETSNLIDSFGVVSETKMEQLDNSLWEAGKSDLAIQILGHTQYLYDVGEANLTDADIVRIGEVECYVLEVSPDNSKAKLITKDIYNVRFDTGGHTSVEVEGHIDTVSGYTDKTYDYKYSTLRTWMNNFYVNKLGADSKILPTTVTYYTSDISTNNLNSYVTGTITDQYVFALDAKEAEQHISKFRWNVSNKQVNDDGSLSNNNSKYFWTTAGFRCSLGYSYAWVAHYSGGFYNDYVNSTVAGARPVFWISLE